MVTLTLTGDACPKPVLLTLRKLVQTQLDKIRAVTRLGAAFSSAMSEVAQAIGTVIQAATNAIPNPTSITVSVEILYTSCPLFTLATAMELSDFVQIDPGVKQGMLKDMLAAEVADALKAYEDTLKAAPEYQGIKAIRDYANQMRGLDFQVDAFLNAVLITAAVFVIAPVEYQAGPYAAFADITQNFSLGTNGLPTDLDTDVASVVAQLNAAEVKLAALRGSLV